MRKSNVYKELVSEYDRKRTKARIELDMRKRDIYERLPRIREIDEEIARLCLKTSLTALSLPESANKLTDNFEVECGRLLKEKDIILQESKIPKKFIEIYYECELCKDTGFIGNAECKCFTLMRIEKAYNMYSLKDKLKYENFDNFDFRYYSASAYKDYSTPPKANMEKVYSYCVRYVRDFGTKYENVIFYGSPGLGKTFLCNCISKDLMDKGHIVLYLTAFQLFRLLDDIQFGRAEDGSFIMDDLLNSDLLIIDDIGTEFYTTFTGTGLFNIINSRANAKKPIIISTNLYPQDIKDTYSERIYSRIASNYTAFELYGENVGSLKKFGRFLS